MAEQDECFVSGPLATILRVTRCAGMAPLRFQKQGNGWRVSLSKCYVLPIFATIINMMFIGTLVRISQEQTKTNQYVLFTDAILTTGLVETLVFGAPKHMRCLISSVNQVQKINSELNIQHWSTPWTRKLIVLSTIWATICVTANLISFSILLYTNLTAQTVDYFLVVGNVFQFLRFYITLSIALGVFQFVLFVLHIRRSFTAVNDCLRNLLNVISPEALEKIFIYAVPIFYYFVYCILNLVLFVEPCHWNSVEMNSTQKLVCRLMLYPRSAYDPLAIELEQFWAQLELNDVSYSPLNVVTFSRSFLIAVLGSISTYLVILIDTHK